MANKKYYQSHHVHTQDGCLKCSTSWISDPKRLKLQARMVKEAGLIPYDQYINN